MTHNIFLAGIGSTGIVTVSQMLRDGIARGFPTSTGS